MSTLPGIAILGAGLFAKEAHLPAIAKLTDAVALKAVYSRSLNSAQELADEAKSLLGETPAVYHDGDAASNLDALLARTDISSVIIALPISTQPAVILKSLAADKHVLSEKPIAKDIAEGIKLIKEYEATYKPKGLIWRVAENFESEPGYRVARRVVREGKIGKVRFFKLQAYNHLSKDSKWYKTPWRTVPDYQGGFIMDGGVHSVALMRTVLPGDLIQVSSFSSLTRDYLAPVDTVQLILKASDGSHGIMDMSFASPCNSRGALGNGFIVTGTNGFVEVIGNAKSETDPTKTVVKVIVTSVKHDKDGIVTEEKKEILEERPCGVEAEVKSFLEVMKGNDDGLGEPRGALVDVAVIEASLHSEGQLVDLKQLMAGL